MTRWRVIVASVVIMVVASACGVTLGSQGAAETARKNLAPVDETPANPPTAGGTSATPSTLLDASGNPVDVFGNRVDEQGRSVDQNGNPIDPALLGGAGADATATTVLGPIPGSQITIPGGGSGPRTATTVAGGPAADAGPTVRPGLSAACQVAITIGTPMQELWVYPTSGDFAHALDLWVAVQVGMSSFSDVATGPVKVSAANIAAFVAASIPQMKTVGDLRNKIAEMADVHRGDIANIGSAISLCARAAYGLDGIPQFDPSTEIPDPDAVRQHFDTT